MIQMQYLSQIIQPCVLQQSTHKHVENAWIYDAASVLIWSLRFRRTDADLFLICLTRRTLPRVSPTRRGTAAQVDLTHIDD